MTLNSKYQKQKEVLSNSEKPPAANLIASYDVPTVLVKEKKKYEWKIYKTMCNENGTTVWGRKHS